MPGTWPDDESDSDDAPLAPLVHPDDRLWRHPSEVAWSAAADPRPAAAPSPPPGLRLWALALTSGLTGAALAIGVVALVGGLTADPSERVVERVGVRDQLVDPLSTRPSTGLADVAADVIPSVVRLEIDTAEGSTVGSGIVILDDGHIVTNAHVVDGATTVTIVLADGTSVPGWVVGTDPVTDIAVVAPDGDHADAAAWVPAVRGPAADLAIGDPAVAVGSALGLSGGPSVTLGVVSALGRRVTTADGGVLHGMIETDAPIASGSSGGALCDRAGRVVGITTSQSADGTAGMGFATPMESVWAVAEALIDDGVVHHVWLGIEGADLDATRSSVLGITGGPGGIVVERVVESGPAEAGGIREGDVLTAIDGERLVTMSDLVMALRSYAPGDDVTVEVHRDGERHELTVTLAAR